jgi:hypothetical protein
MIKSYRHAEDLFAKARKPEAGKPLEARNWRLHREDADYILKVTGYPVARVRPDNTLRLILPDDTSFPQIVTFKFHEALPFILRRRSNHNYRIHPALDGQEGRLSLVSCGYTEWGQFNTDGYRLYDGLTFDLSTRTAMDYKEPQLSTHVELNRWWLQKSKALKLHLKTMAKLGAFDAMWDQSTSMSRWEAASVIPILPHEHAELKLFIDALNGENMTAFALRVGESIYSDHFNKPSVDAQLGYIDSIFTRNSLTLRKALGVVTRN